MSSANEAILPDKGLPGTVQPVSLSQGGMHMDSITHHCFFFVCFVAALSLKGTMLKAKLYPISFFFLLRYLEL